MGKFVGLVGALTTLGAMAYLMAPLPTGGNSGHSPEQSTAPSAAVARVETVVASAKSIPPAPQRESATSLVHQIQLELQRLGCYAGSIDGKWSDATQRAMQEFGERLSVLRPVDNPDYIMLALAREQQRSICTQGQLRAAATRPTTRFETTAASAKKETPEAPVARKATPPTRTAAAEPPRAPRAATPPPPLTQATARGPTPQRSVELSPTEIARAAAARDELARIEQRAPVIARPADNRQAAAQSPTEPAPAQASRVTLENGRMSLGVVDVDPLRAGIDPRDPNAPAILRGPPQPTPVTTARAGTPTDAVEAAPPPPRRPARTVSEPATQPTAKQSRRAWQRSIFLDMQRNGP